MKLLHSQHAMATFSSSRPILSFFAASKLNNFSWCTSTWGWCKSHSFPVDLGLIHCWVCHSTNNIYIYMYVYILYIYIHIYIYIYINIYIYNIVHVIFLDLTSAFFSRKVITCWFLYVLPSLGYTTWEEISSLLIDDFAEDAKQNQGLLPFVSHIMDEAHHWHGGWRSYSNWAKNRDF